MSIINVQQTNNFSGGIDYTASPLAQGEINKIGLELESEATL